MKKQTLGQTGMLVSPIGLGTVKFGRNQAVKYPQAFDLPSDQEIIHLLAVAKELEINVLDTAPAYGTSEQRIGKLLTHRQDWVIVSKAGEFFSDGHSEYRFDPHAIEHSVKDSLKNLNTDYIDVLLIHSDGNDVDIIDHDRVFDTLQRLKAAGFIRAFGMSSKTVAGGLLTLEKADVAMVTYNPEATEERIVIETAHQKNKGIFIKKALFSGHLHTHHDNHDPVQTNMDFIFSTPGVSSVIIGTLNPAHLRHNVDCAARAILRS